MQLLRSGGRCWVRDYGDVKEEGGKEGGVVLLVLLCEHEIVGYGSFKVFGSVVARIFPF